MTISGFVAYVKQQWRNKPDTSTPVSAARLEHIEEGVKNGSDSINQIAAAVVSQILNDPNKIASMAALYAVNQNVVKNTNDITKLNSDLGAVKTELSVKAVDISPYKVASIVGTTSICYLQKYGKIAIITIGTALLKYQKEGSNIIFTIPGYIPELKTAITVRGSDGNVYNGFVMGETNLSIQIDNLPTGDLYISGQFTVMLK